MRNRRSLGRALALALASATLAGQALGGQLGRSGRWFTVDGVPKYLIGIDSQELAADTTIDSTAKLDAIRDAGLNKVRIWVYNYFLGCRTGFSHPAPLVGCPSAPEFQFVWNDSYWAQVKAFVQAAGARGIYVEVTVFAPNNLDSAAGWNGTGNSPWPNLWNDAYNDIGAFAANAAGHFIPDFFNLNTAQNGFQLRGFQEAFVNKTIFELGEEPNVYIEIANEFPLGGTKTGACGAAPPPSAADANNLTVVAWHKYFIDYAATRTSRLVAAHTQQGWGPNLKGASNYWELPNLDVMNFHLYNYDPACVSQVLSPAQRKGKLLSNNESGNYRLQSDGGLDGQTRLAWATLVSGAHFGLYEDDSSLIGDAAFQAAARRLFSVKFVAESMAFWRMSPVRPDGSEFDNVVTNGPAAQWQVLAEDAAQYLVYYWDVNNAKRTNAARIYLPAGTWAYTWYDARTAFVRARGQVTGGVHASILSPGVSQWNGPSGVVLKVVRTGP